VFIKPHAVTDATRARVEGMLKDAGLAITGQGQKTASEIEEGKLIDTHYYAIASKATLMKPEQLNVPKDKFEEFFGVAWDDALSQGKVYNALDACAVLGVDASTMNQMWADTKANKKLVKFGGGFYCGEVKPEVYVFNGFFMQMRSNYVAPGKSIYWFTVEWDENMLSWADFRGKVLGPTDPNDAPPTSIRGTILAEWETLGLPAVPNTGDNGVHASASPFEAFAERKNWLGASVSDETIGRALLDAGMTMETIESWCTDPSVTNAAEGKIGSLWDQLEDTDTSECMQKILPGFATAEAPGASKGFFAEQGLYIASGLTVGLVVGLIVGKKVL